MIARYQVLSRRIELELGELERTQAAAQRHWQTARTTTIDQDAYLNSVALNLHGFYSGLERIFELIAQELDGGVVGGDAWHTELLRQMALDVPDVRPPVLQMVTADQLDEYRKFRHRIRNAWLISSSVFPSFGLRSARSWKALPGSCTCWPMRMLNEASPGLKISV